MDMTESNLATWALVLLVPTSMSTSTSLTLGCGDLAQPDHAVLVFYGVMPLAGRTKQTKSWSVIPYVHKFGLYTCCTKVRCLYTVDPEGSWTSLTQAGPRLGKYTICGSGLTDRIKQLASWHLGCSWHLGFRPQYVGPRLVLLPFRNIVTAPAPASAPRISASNSSAPVHSASSAPTPTIIYAVTLAYQIEPCQTTPLTPSNLNTYHLLSQDIQLHTLRAPHTHLNHPMAMATRVEHLQSSHSGTTKRMRNMEQSCNPRRKNSTI